VSTSFKMVAKTLYGFEEILAKELRNLGAQKVTIGNRMVSFYGDTGFMYKANLCLRTAIKILNIQWDNYLTVDDTFAIHATVNSTLFNHSKFIALKAKDAIVDKFRRDTGMRPNVELDYPDLSIDIHIQQDLCTVSLDSSGGSLHLRGYRTSTNIAPINEVLAAGLIMLSGWDGQCDFLDPMCGSGTLAIEAAMIACNIPPNLNRKEFAFEKWLDWDMDLFEKIEEACLNKTRDFQYTIVGMDKARSVVKKAITNVENANLSDFIKIKEGDFFESEKEIENHLHMVFNPPYDERLEINMPEFYGQIGDTLKKSYPGTNAWFITGNLEALKHVGLRPSRKIKLFNGKLESRLLKYEMYAGSKRMKFQKNNDI